MSVSQKLSHFLELADQGPALRAALAEELAELLINWPSQYPKNMRDVCEALLSKVADEVDTLTRTRLRSRLAITPQLLAKVCPPGPSATQLVEACRSKDGVCAVLAQRLGLNQDMAQKILKEKSGHALAIACKGANIERAAFSAMALLIHQGCEKTQMLAILDAFDRVPINDAAHMLARWRVQPALADLDFTGQLAAAE